LTWQSLPLFRPLETTRRQVWGVLGVSGQEHPFWCFYIDLAWSWQNKNNKTTTTSKKENIVHFKILRLLEELLLCVWTENVSSVEVFVWLCEATLEEYIWRKLSKIFQLSRDQMWVATLGRRHHSDLIETFDFFAKNTLKQEMKKLPVFYRPYLILIGSSPFKKLNPTKQ
jgi:hypothetical protein